MNYATLEHLLFRVECIVFTSLRGVYPSDVIERTEKFTDLYSARHEDIRNGKVITSRHLNYDLRNIEFLFAYPEQARRANEAYQTLEEANQSITDTAIRYEKDKPLENMYRYTVYDFQRISDDTQKRLLEASPLKDEMRDAILNEIKYAKYIQEIKRLISDNYDELDANKKRMAWHETQGMIIEKVEKARLLGIQHLFRDVEAIYEQGYHCRINRSSIEELVSEINVMTTRMKQLQRFNVSGISELEFLFDNIRGCHMADTDYWYENKNEKYFYQVMLGYSEQ